MTQLIRLWLAQLLMDIANGFAWAARKAVPKP
jgi:hypothetical protein